MKVYSAERNDPTKDSQSNLSPYLHYGSISAQRVILEAQKYKAHSAESYNSFLEELVIRKELSGE